MFRESSIKARQRFGLCLGLCLATATLAASKEDAIPFGSPENRPADFKPSAVNMVFTSRRQDKNDTNKDLEILQGTWKVVKSALLDEDYRKYFEEHGKVVIKGSTMTFLVDDPKAKPVKFVEFTIMVDSSKSPGTFDLTLDSIDAPEKHFLGIYRLQDNTLKFYVGDIGKERPKEFPKSGQGVVELKREKP
jgi:uncharacterized protein (TIGR03067 family)